MPADINLDFILCMGVVSVELFFYDTNDITCGCFGVGVYRKCMKRF